MNKEMDLLLRRLSRRQDSSRSNGDASIVGEHLDADELSSYAENALPAAARTRYTEHLAECAGCRELIVQLSLSAGAVIAAEESAKTPAPSGLRNFLASLFSPLVLRYSIPALGLIAVAAIAFISLRKGDHMASRIATPAPSPSVNYSLDSNGQVATFNSNDKSASPAVETDKSRQAKPSHEDVAAPPPNAPPMVGLHAEVSKDADAKKADDQQTAASTASAPQPTPAPSVATEEAKKSANEPPKEVSQRAVSDLPVKQPSTTSEFEKSKIGRGGEIARPGSRTERSARERSSAPASGAVVQSAQADSTQRDGVDESDNAEIRSVAGRRFRKQGDRWIDTAFNSGTSTVNVSRGSEQFRALVADEPEIKTIADRLDGEVIVVWKGRAYRIR